MTGEPWQRKLKRNSEIQKKKKKPKHNSASISAGALLHNYITKSDQFHRVEFYRADS